MKKILFEKHKNKPEFNKYGDVIECSKEIITKEILICYFEKCLKCVKSKGQIEIEGFSMLVKVNIGDDIPIITIKKNYVDAYSFNPDYNYEIYIWNVEYNISDFSFKISKEEYDCLLKKTRKALEDVGINKKIEKAEKILDFLQKKI